MGAMNMKRIGKFVILTNAEVVKLYDKGVREGKFHASGGYAHALAETRRKLWQAQDLLAEWRPFVVALETTPGQLTDRRKEVEP
jgi:hypothetical protein